MLFNEQLAHTIAFDRLESIGNTVGYWAIVIDKTHGKDVKDHCKVTFEIDLLA